MVIFDEMHAREVLKEMFGECDIFDYISEGMIECCQDGTWNPDEEVMS